MLKGKMVHLVFTERVANNEVLKYEVADQDASGIWVARRADYSQFFPWHRIHEVQVLD